MKINSGLTVENGMRVLALKVLFFEWAYGMLAESDSDIGALAEFMIGRALGCLPRGRSDNSPYDLTTSDGTTLEIKATSCAKPSGRTGKGERWRWKIVSQRRMLDGTARPADVWIFARVEFPETAPKQRYFDVFDPKWWTFSVVSGAVLLSAGVSTYVSEATLRRMSAVTCSLDGLPSAVSAAANVQPR
jgi:hypothetical protein